MAQDDLTVFEKILHAAQDRESVTLTFAEIELLLDVLDDDFGLAQQLYDRWRGIFENYEDNSRPRP